MSAPSRRPDIRRRRARKEKVALTGDDCREGRTFKKAIEEGIDRFGEKPPHREIAANGARLPRQSVSEDIVFAQFFKKSKSARA